MDFDSFLKRLAQRHEGKKAELPSLNILLPFDNLALLGHAMAETCREAGKKLMDPPMEKNENARDLSNLFPDMAVLAGLAVIELKALQAPDPPGRKLYVLPPGKLN